MLFTLRRHRRKLKMQLASPREWCFWQGSESKGLKIEYNPFRECGWKKPECTKVVSRAFVHLYYRKRLSKYLVPGRILTTKKHRFSMKFFLLDADVVNVKQMMELGGIRDDELWWSSSRSHNRGRRPLLSTMRDFTQRRREAFTTAFATERVWGDNLGLSTVECRYATMDFRTALLARNAKHVIFRREMYFLATRPAGFRVICVYRLCTIYLYLIYALLSCFSITVIIWLTTKNFCCCMI